MLYDCGAFWGIRMEESSPLVTMNLQFCMNYLLKDPNFCVYIQDLPNNWEKNNFQKLVNDTVPFSAHFYTTID